jgi:hypothetical protein
MSLAAKAVSSWPLAMLPGQVFRMRTPGAMHWSVISYLLIKRVE